MEHERTKGCDTLIQVARLKTILVTNAALKAFEGQVNLVTKKSEQVNLEILVDLKLGICLCRHKHLRTENINVRVCSGL